MQRAMETKQKETDQLVDDFRAELEREEGDAIEEPEAESAIVGRRAFRPSKVAPALTEKVVDAAAPREHKAQMSAALDLPRSQIASSSSANPWLAATNGSAGPARQRADVSTKSAIRAGKQRAKADDVQAIERAEREVVIDLGANIAGSGDDDDALDEDGIAVDEPVQLRGRKDGVALQRDLVARAFANDDVVAVRRLSSAS